MSITDPLACTGSYDEALERYHRTGPEFEGYLSNHGPMVVEALARLGRAEDVHSWTDRYLDRLDETPRGIAPIATDEWESALGDPARAGDWIAYFRERVSEQPWQEQLARWWPRLLPGIAAGATHGVIRVGHAVRALRAAESGPRHQELAHALAYWATRWQAVPVVTAGGSYDVGAALAGIPRVRDQHGGIRDRLAQLDDLEGWRPALGMLAGPGQPVDVPAALDDLVSGVLAHYAVHAHGNPTMMVHAVTAPTAVLNALPSLPASLWRPSFDAAWSAAGAVLSAYLPDSARPAAVPPDAETALERALHHGGEHVIKLTDAALRSHELTGAEHALAAAAAAVDLDA